MTISPTSQAGPQHDRRHWLATCEGDEHAEAVADLLYRREHRNATEAAADAAALAGNPCTDFEDFARLVAQHLDQWVLHPSHHPDGQPEYQIPVDAPGQRAADWWPELALLDTHVAFGVTLRPWHAAWLARRAFPVADPVQWARFYRRFSTDDMHGRELTRWLIGVLRHRSLPHERDLVTGEQTVEQDAPFARWDEAWHRLRRGVPARSTREQAKEGLARMLLDPAAEPERSAVLAPVRLAVVADFLSDGPERLFAEVDDRVSLLTPDDLCTLVRESGRCVSQSVHGWVQDMYWPSFGVRDAGRSIALTLAPLDSPLAEPHLRCRAPSHRIALTLNPFTPTNVGVAAIERGLEETEHLLTSRVQRVRDAYPVMERWWRVMMAVRGWFPAKVVQDGMQRVSAWMLRCADPISDWLRPLAVFASQPDGLRAMSTTQLARFDALVADRTARSPARWNRTAGGDRYAEVMSPQVLRQVLAVTGWSTSGLLVDPAVVPLLAGLPVDLRVEAARRGDDRVLAHLVHDPEPRVRQFVARNRRASAATLDVLVGDPEPRVRSQVARNAGVTAPHLVRMSHDPDTRVSRAASRALLNRLAAA